MPSRQIFFSALLSPFLPSLFNFKLLSSGIACYSSKSIRMSGPCTRVVGKNCRVKTKIKERETRSTREREERTREGGCEGEENRDRFNYADNNHNNGFAYHRALSPPGPSIPPHCSRQPPAFALAFALALARSLARVP